MPRRLGVPMASRGKTGLVASSTEIAPQGARG